MGNLGKMMAYGRVAEWPIAAVLKTAVGQPTVGSNPTSSEVETNSYPCTLSRAQGFRFFHPLLRADLAPNGVL